MYTSYQRWSSLQGGITPSLTQPKHGSVYIAIIRQSFFMPLKMGVRGLKGGYHKILCKNHLLGVHTKYVKVDGWDKWGFRGGDPKSLTLGLLGVHSNIINSRLLRSWKNGVFLFFSTTKNGVGSHLGLVS